MRGASRGSAGRTFHPGRTGLEDMMSGLIESKSSRAGSSRATTGTALQIRNNRRWRYFLYQAALVSVKPAHFSGKSSSEKMAETGQTGTQAPQSMHSTGS